MPPRPRDAAQSSATETGFKLEEFLPFQLSVTAARVSRAFARRFAERFDLSIPEWRVLTIVGRYETASPSMVSEKASMDKVKVSRAAATLVARGLLRQGPDPSDGRGRLLRLTRKGASVHAAIVPLAQAMETELAGAMSRADWAALNKAMARLNAHLEASEGPDYAEAAE